MSILFIIPAVVVFIILFIVVAVFASRKDDSDEERVIGMMKTFYVYLVCFATLMMSIGGGVAAFMAVSDIIVPDAYYMNYEDYKNNQNYKFADGNEKVEDCYRAGPVVF